MRAPCFHRRPSCRVRTASVLVSLWWILVVTTTTIPWLTTTKTTTKTKTTKSLVVTWSADAFSPAGQCPKRPSSWRQQQRSLRRQGYPSLVDNDVPSQKRNQRHDGAVFVAANTCESKDDNDDDCSNGVTTSSVKAATTTRRDWFCRASIASAAAAATTFVGSWPRLAAAEDSSTFTPLQASEEVSSSSSSSSSSPPAMKEFVDPAGYFSIRIPKTYFALRRSAKGDLPDEKTGRGRRGSSIFTAGDMGKAEIVAVERFPTRLLLEDNGIEVEPGDGGDEDVDLSTFSKIGEPAAVANLLNLRRERERQQGTTGNAAAAASGGGGGGGPGTTSIIPGSIEVSADDRDLFFQLKSEIEVQKPELLLEQYGVSRLFRVTAAKATLRSGDGNIMAAYASALESDWNGPDGLALTESVRSFRVSDSSSSP